MVKYSKGTEALLEGGDLNQFARINVGKAVNAGSKEKKYILWGAGQSMAFQAVSEFMLGAGTILVSWNSKLLPHESEIDIMLRNLFIYDILTAGPHASQCVMLPFPEMELDCKARRYKEFIYFGDRFANQLLVSGHFARA